MDAMRKKEKRDDKSTYIEGLQMIASLSIVAVYLIIMAVTAIIFPMWLGISVMMAINNIFFGMFLVTPCILVLGILIGYHWWWVCKYYLQNFLPKWFTLEL